MKARVKGKITKRGEGCEGEAFTHIVQGIKELREKGEEVKAKIENSLMRAYAREGYFRPKSAGISPHWSVRGVRASCVRHCLRRTHEMAVAESE